MPYRVLLSIALTLWCGLAGASEWKTAWTASAQGPYPSGYPIAHPGLRVAFPDPQAGAVTQAFRMMVRPDIWSARARVRFTNVFGTEPVTFAQVYMGLQQGGGAVVPMTNQQMLFDGEESLTLEPGESRWSDPVFLPFFAKLGPRFLYGRKLAVSFHVAGQSGPMTWHAQANGTNFLSAQNVDAVSADESERGYPFSTASWYFIDAVDMLAASSTDVIVCLGDSLTDGLMSTLNGDDRWPDALSRLARAKYGNTLSIVNAGISGNQILNPPNYTYSAKHPVGAGPFAEQRVERDVLSLSGVTAVIWLEGINDLHHGHSAERVAAGMENVVRQMREAQPALRIFAGTIISTKGAVVSQYGSDTVNRERLALNEFIRTSDIFDGVVDFDAALVDAETGMMRDIYVPDSVYGSAGDRIHPNRAGYGRMATAVRLDAVLPKR
ncbi:MAG: GDSL-type esterase/lipase family protein [Planctomycetaceae bacterium]|nr:GDSL-type esterase/lipase family protein [Planctomycetaceae bacterium]